ncbi:Rne/Rng family ribonuclease [Arcanobacterium canis]|uniref:Rne/Rng family ribonuclease n=1 Tax=Arcanobacterium canis TaxID=999183 RepID=A0ABY8FZN3_9ACTO|nr:Rne/Rng family ribonuclease [Arcanobacterium canis]WFM83980.1 Rne/Rng family ribonuclease [Arcanobacterium canis]
MAEEANEKVASTGATEKTVTKRASRSRKAPAKHEGAAESVAQSLAVLAQEKGKSVFSEADNTAHATDVVASAPMTALLFQEPDVEKAVRARRARKSVAVEESEVASDESVSNSEEDAPKRRRRGTRGGRKSAEVEVGSPQEEVPVNDAVQETPKKKRTRRKKSSESEESTPVEKADSMNDEETVESDEMEVAVRRRRRRRSDSEEVSAPRGSTRLEAKRQRRKESRAAGRRRQTVSEAEYLARRESVDREMLVRERDGLNQIAVIEDGVLVEHFVARHTQTSMVGNVYLGRVQNVLPSMEAAFVDIGKGRNAVLYAGEVNWEAAGLEGKPRKIEQALKSGDTVLVQVTKDPIGHKGARLTSQVTLAGRHLVLVPSGAMTGISRKLPERERTRLKKILKEIVPAGHGVIVRTAAEGATEEQLRDDIERLTKSWEDIEAKSKSTKNAPSLLKGEPELAVRVVRDIFNEDFRSLKVQGDNAWATISEYVKDLSPELIDRVEHWESADDIFAANRVDEQLQKAFDRKVILPSGGSLVIDRTEAMTVIDVNTGKFTGAKGGTLEETVTMNNLEAAEEIVRQLRLRDIGGIIVVDFIDMVLEANRDLVLRRLIECLGRDRTRHQVAEVTSLGLVQMTRKRVGQGLVEAFSTTCEACEGRGYITHEHPVERGETTEQAEKADAKRDKSYSKKAKAETEQIDDSKRSEVKAALNSIAAAAVHKHDEAEASNNAADGVNDMAGGDMPTRGRGRRGRGKKSDDSSSQTHSPVNEDGMEEKPARRRGRPRKASVDQEQHDRYSSGDSAPVKMEDADQARTEDEATRTAGEVQESATNKPARRSRIISSSGTITPPSSATSAFLSFPKK